MIAELREKDFSSLKKGLSGVMRVHNEERLIEACIDSCINSLDELIVVCFDCTDGTESILERKKAQYPDKLRVFQYNRRVLSFNLTKEEHELALSLPDDDERLYCNLCNFGLAQVRYQFATKIDTDQNYFEDEIKKWRDICAGVTGAERKLSHIIGWAFTQYFSIYRRVSAMVGKPLTWMIPEWLVMACKRSYLDFAAYQLQLGKVSIALSGVNVFKDGEWYIPFDMTNIHPPFNGEGDTVIFKMSDRTFFTRTHSEKVTLSVTEKFTNPYRMMFSGPVWFHQHANRYQCWDKVKKEKDRNPDAFVPINDFFKMSYSDILKKQDPKVTTLFQRTLFALVHRMSGDVVKNHLHVLDKSGI